MNVWDNFSFPSFIHPSILCMDNFSLNADKGILLIIRRCSVLPSQKHSSAFRTEMSTAVNSLSKYCLGQEHKTSPGGLDQQFTESAFLIRRQPITCFWGAHEKSRRQQFFPVFCPQILVFTGLTSPLIQYWSPQLRSPTSHIAFVTHISARSFLHFHHPLLLY